MTAEQRIALLEAELTEERAERRRLSALVEQMVLAQVAKAREETDAKATRRARNVRHRAKTSTETTGETSPGASHETSPGASHETSPGASHETSTPPPPPLDGSPPLPAPISPSPLSSPPALFSVASQGETPEAAVSGKRQPGRTNALGEFIDFARAETRKHLAPDAPDNCRLEKHQAARLGEAVKLHGLEACKAAFRLWMGWEGSRAAGYPLGMFAAKWEGWVGRVKASGAKPAAASAGKPTVGGYGYDNPYVQALVEAMPAPKKRGA